MSASSLDLTFAHAWSAEILLRRPVILPMRQFVYPKHAEEIERGALEVMIRPVEAEPFLATFALGFADPAIPTGVWSCPDSDWLCAVAGGYGYLVNTRAPEQFEQIQYRPLLFVRALVSHRILIFAGYHSLLAWGAEGRVWQTPRLSSEGLEITRIEGNCLEGMGWDLITDRNVPFMVDLRTGASL